MTQAILSDALWEQHFFLSATDKQSWSVMSLCDWAAAIPPTEHLVQHESPELANKGAEKTDFKLKAQNVSRFPNPAADPGRGYLKKKDEMTRKKKK